jgi:predicted small lipoprotein YifL
VTPAHADGRNADAEVAMRTRLLLLAPILVSIAGCGEKSEAQEDVSAPGEIGLPPGKPDTAEKAEVEEPDVKLRSPVGLD